MKFKQDVNMQRGSGTNLLFVAFYTSSFFFSTFFLVVLFYFVLVLAIGYATNWLVENIRIEQLMPELVKVWVRRA